MPTSRQRATAVSSETRSILPQIPLRSGTAPTSYLYSFTTPLPHLPKQNRYKFRSAVINGDPLDVAVDWQNYSFPKISTPNSSSNSPSNGPTSGSAFPFPPTGAPGPSGAVYSSAGETLNSAQRAPPVFFQSIIQNKPTNRILVLNTANDKKPGGEWEGGVLSQEEAMARRSNLVQALAATDPRAPDVTNYYPLLPTAGIYSPNVVVFREGMNKDYTMWRDEDWITISVVSASAVRRPKVDESGLRYSFIEEKDLQKEKMKTALRIAATNGHVNLVLGGFGSCGPRGFGGGIYKNPIRDVCAIWKELLTDTEEFAGWFANVVFAVGGGENGAKEDCEKVEEFRRYFG